MKIFNLPQWLGGLPQMNSLLIANSSVILSNQLLTNYFTINTFFNYVNSQKKAYLALFSHFHASKINSETKMSYPFYISILWWIRTIYQNGTTAFRNINAYYKEYNYEN